MIFVNKEWDEIDDIIVYSNYHKYWQNKELRIKNPYFDVFSGRIPDLKEGKQSAVKYFYNLINEEICKDVTICVVPSSDADKKESGIGMLGEMLAADGRKNKVYYLQRTKSTDANCSNKSRGIRENRSFRGCETSFGEPHVRELPKL